jgi:hypothetical protein
LRQLIILVAILPAIAAVTIPTGNYDLGRDGYNASETLLTPANVSSGFGLLGSWNIDGGNIRSQPIYVPVGVYRAWIVGTGNGNLYALDSANPGSAPVWSLNLEASPQAGGTGINGSPVADVANGWIFVVSASSTNVYTMRKVSLATGSLLSSTVITGSYPGTGAGTVNGVTDITSGGNVIFNSAWQLQHVPLLLTSGKVYASFGSFGNEAYVWHGWVMSYDEVTLAQQNVLCTSPNSDGAGLWGASGGSVVDGNGNIYFATGNGNTYNSGTDLPQSIVKTNAALVVQDWFTRSDWSSSSAGDSDLASGHLMLVPGTQYLVICAKDRNVYVLNAGSLGHIGGQSQNFSVTGTGVAYGGAFINSIGYFPVGLSPIVAYSWTGSAFTTSALAGTATSYTQGATVAGSSNAGTNTVIWGVAAVAGVSYLNAFDPGTLAVLWTSSGIGTMGKWVQPVVADGKVVAVNNTGTIYEYGLTSVYYDNGHSVMRGKASLRGSAVLR